MTTSTPELFLAQIRAELHKVLQHWASQSVPPGAFANLTLFQKIVRQTNSKPRAIDQLLTDLLTILDAENELYAWILRRRFVDNIKAQSVAHEKDWGEANFYNVQRLALDRLAELLYEAELNEREAQRLAMEQILEPPTYTALVGVETSLHLLWEEVMQPTSPWLLLLEGMGGLGKTSLANALMRRVIADPAPFVNIGWVTARHSSFDPGGRIVAENQPALTTDALVEMLWQQLLAATMPDAALSHDQKLAMLHALLRRQPHLIVIDNLETLTDVRALLPLLQSLINPTKFLLTSRERIGGGVGIFCFTVPALTEEDSVQLVRQEAVTANVPHLVKATNAELQPIYATVGGNPLALRLVVGQVKTQPLATVLDDLAAKRGAKVDQLYTYLYRRAWEQLEDDARTVWLTMPLLTEAVATVENLARYTDLDAQPVREALDQLVQLNLVNCYTDLYSARFTLHNLTRTFLINEIGRLSV